MREDAAQRSPRRRAVLGAVICVGVVLALAAWLHREVIFEGHVYHMDDAADGYYPGHIAVERAFAHGELPTWELGSWCGWPLVVDPYNGVFYPANVIYYLLGAARGLGFSLLLHVLLGGAGLWWLLRRRKLGHETALFGAISFALSTFFVVRIRHVIFLQMMGWLPWILVGIEGWCQTRRRRELVLVAASTALALVAGALSIGHFAALVIAGFAIGRIATAARESGLEHPVARLRHALVDAGALMGGALVGALCAAAQLVPTVAHLPLSPRSLGSDYAFASSYAWPNLDYFWTLFMPDYYGVEDRWHYLGAPNHWELCGWYVGAVAVALAVFALLPPRRGEPRRRGVELFVLVGLVLLAIGLALGDAGPLHKWFFHHVPLYAALRCPARALLMAVLALPILGAHGVAALLELRLPLRRWVGIAAGLVATLLGALLVWKFRALPRQPEAIALQHAALRHLLLVGTAGVVVLLLAITGRLPRRSAAALLALVAAVDLYTIDRGYLVPQPADYPSGMERFAAVEWLVAHDHGDRFVNDPRGPFRLHNVGMVLGMENASGYDSVGIWRYVDLLYLVNNGRPYPEKKLKHDFAGIGVWNLSSPILDVMNVRWLIAENAPPPTGPASPHWIERFRPSGATGAPAAKYEPSWDQRLKVFENPDALPHAFVTYRAEVLPSDATLAARMASPSFAPGTVALLEQPPSPSVPPPRPGETAPPPTPATVLARSRHLLDLDVTATAPGILVVGDAWYPGWHVEVDGHEAPLLRADWAFRGVALDAGHHRVTLRFTSRPTQVGIALSLCGLLALALLGLARRRPDGETNAQSNA